MAIVALPTLAFLADNDAAPPLVWGSGGGDPRGAPDDMALLEEAIQSLMDHRYISRKAGESFKRQIYLPDAASYEDIQEGQIFNGMHSGHGRIDNRIAAPNMWPPGANTKMRVWFYVERLPSGHKQITALYQPEICGNTASFVYPEGVKTCIDLPASYKLI